MPRADAAVRGLASPGIEDRYAEVREMPGVVGGNSEVVFHGGRGEKPIDVAKGLPCCCDLAASIPQRSEIALVTGRRLSPSHPFRSLASHCSSSLRFLLGGRSCIPLRISPMLRTRVKGISG